MSPKQKVQCYNVVFIVQDVRVISRNGQTEVAVTLSEAELSKLCERVKEDGCLDI